MHVLAAHFLIGIPSIHASAPLYQLNCSQRTASESCNRNSINLGAIVANLLSDYDTHLLPEGDGTNVTIELHVQGITGISELTADFTLDIMYRYTQYMLYSIHV